MSTTKIVVTGGAGYIGSVVTGHLLAGGSEVQVFDKLVYGGESLLAFHAHPRFRFLKGDVRNRQHVIEALQGAEAVIHLAAIVGEPACSIDETAAWSVNYCGTETVLSAARECGVHGLIFVSTCSNYGISDPGQLADENFPLRPISHYARSKVKAEDYILNNAGPVCATVLRLGTICGLSARMRFDLLVSEMARSAVLGEPIQLFAPEAWRPFLHVRDAARAIAQCLQSSDGLVRDKVFNVVSENYQKKQLADLVLKHYPGANISITEKKADLRDYRASGERISRELGFSAQLTVEDAFLETAAAVAQGVFRDPCWPGHSAVPLDVNRIH